MSKEKSLEKINELLDMAKVAFSDDYLCEIKKSQDIKVSSYEKFKYKQAINNIKENITQHQEMIDLDLKKSKSEYSDMDYFELEKTVLSCSKCMAANIRKHVIFGKGPRPASLMVIGEGPGRDEDYNNDLFVGRSGQYLYKWLEAINLNVQSDVYLSNIVKCFSNNNPTKDMVDLCFPYLERQIELVNPKAILVLGKIAGNTLFKQELPMKDMRGKIYTYKRIPCIVTYHPAAVLRNPDWRRPVWDDIKKVKQLINI